MQSQKLVTVIGGSGFIGRHVVRALAKEGYRVRVACRRPDLAFHLQPLGGVGQIQLMQCNVRYPHSIDAALEGADAVVNLTGILFAKGKQTFDAVQLQGAKNIAQSAKSKGIKSFVHLSAIGADKNSKSPYQSTKGMAEAAILDVLPSAVILRPSVVFGPEDNFFNLFAMLATFSPIMPLIGGGKTLFAPVCVSDVAAAVAKAVAGDLKSGTIYELGGAEEKTFAQCLELTCNIIERKRAFIPIPSFAAKAAAFFMEFMPTPLLTRDQVDLLGTHNVVSLEAKQQGRTLQGMGITPTTLEVVLPSYLWRFRECGQFRQKKAV